MKRYDFILAGGGLAGLSLAYHLIHSPLYDRSILIVDRESKTRNDRTWCFWTDQPTPFDSIVYRSWDRLKFVGEDFSRTIRLGDYRYNLIRGLDLYCFILDELMECGNVEFVRGNIEAIRDGEEGATVVVDGEEYSGRWVFDSRFKISSFGPDPSRYHNLRQYFKGWMVETPVDCFDPEAPSFMDMRTPQKNELRFFYVLPYSARQALVEFVTMSPERYDEAFRAYMEKALEITAYRATPIEGGVNPLTDFQFRRRAGNHVMNIGTRGGRVKGTTGYAFLRIQQDSEHIVESLTRENHPFAIPADSSRYRLYDSLMLDVIQKHGSACKMIFTALFKNNPIERVFQFLDETASLAENSLLIASLPPQLFLQSLFRFDTWPVRLKESHHV